MASPSHVGTQVPPELGPLYRVGSTEGGLREKLAVVPC